MFEFLFVCFKKFSSGLGGDLIFQLDRVTDLAKGPPLERQVYLKACLKDR